MQLTESIPPASGIILAGGASRRMGRDKAWLELDGVPLIVHVLNSLRALSEDIVIATNDPARFQGLGARLVGDEISNAGPLAGICAGLAAAQNQFGLVVACDMPFLNPELLRYLLALAPGHDVVVPSFPLSGSDASSISSAPRAKDLDLHPLHAVYSKNCVEPMRAALRRGERRLVSFYEAVRVRVVEPAEIATLDSQGISLRNINTPQDLARAQEWKRE